MELIGVVVRLQVQRSRLKPGPRGERVYDPSPLLAVQELEVGPRGVVGLVSGGEVLDVHHADHPDTRNRRLRNGLSVLSRGQYARLRQTYGGHVVDGSAGESLLLDTEDALVPEDLAGPLALETEAGLVELGEARVAAPCVEFSRWVLGGLAGGTAGGLAGVLADGGAGGPVGGGVDEPVRAALADLDGGRRGFYLEVCGSGRVRPGASLWRL